MNGKAKDDLELSVVSRSVPFSVIEPKYPSVDDDVLNDPYVVDEYVNVCRPLHVLEVVVPKPRDIVFVDLCSGYVNVNGFSYVPKSDTCDFVIERLGSVVIPLIDVVADSLLSKSVFDQYLFVEPCARASVVVAEKYV